jgi:hypothetical protein
MMLKKEVFGLKYLRYPTQAETMDELIQNIYEAVEGCLDVDIEPSSMKGTDRILELAV